MTSDDRLREQFGELRRRDQVAAPGFEHVLRAEGRARRAGWPRWRVAAHPAAMAGAAVVVFALCVVRSRDPEARVVSASEWRPMTDALLGVNRPTLLEAMPPLRSSMLDRYIR